MTEHQQPSKLDLALEALRRDAASGEGPELGLVGRRMVEVGAELMAADANSAAQCLDDVNEAAATGLAGTPFAHDLDMEALRSPAMREQVRIASLLGQVLDLCEAWQSEGQDGLDCASALGVVCGGILRDVMQDHDDRWAHLLNMARSMQTGQAIPEPGDAAPARAEFPNSWQTGFRPMPDQVGIVAGVCDQMLAQAIAQLPAGGSWGDLLEPSTLRAVARWCAQRLRSHIPDDKACRGALLDDVDHGLLAHFEARRAQS